MAAQFWNDIPLYGKLAVGAGAVILTTVALKKLCCKAEERPRLITTNWKRDVVYLYQFPRSPYIPNPSPYALKLETFFRHAKIRFLIFFELCTEIAVILFFDYHFLALILLTL